MLPENVLVKLKAAKAKLYDGTMTVTEHQKSVQSNHSTAFTDVVVQTNKPCRLSFASSPSAGNGDSASLTQSIKLFFGTDFTIKEGSKISVTQNSKTTDYKQSGSVAKYDSHQEVNLELFKGWA